MVKMVNTSSAKVTIKIPRPLYRKVSSVIEGAGYNSVTDFVVYVLRDLVASHELAGREELKPEEMEMVKQRLKSMKRLGFPGK